MREILKAFTKTTSGTVASLALNAVTVKILAVLLGPSAIGLLSLLRQIYNTTLIAATMSGQTALIQGGSSREGDDRISYLRTVLIVFLLTGCISAIVLYGLSSLLAQRVLNRTDESAVWLVRLLVLPVVLTVINGFYLGVLNIHHHLGRLALIQIAAAGATALLAYPTALLVQQGYEVALSGIVLLIPLITFGLALFSLHKMRLLGPLFASLHTGFQWNMARGFYSFAGITVITALLQSGIMLLVRSWIVAQDGLKGAGIFDAAWTLSMTYVTLLTAAFGTYYLPTLSALGQTTHRVMLMQRVFRFTTMMVTPLLLGVIVLKPLLLRLLFSTEFLPAISLMSWMLIGDFFKLTSWVKAYPMLAFAELRIFFWTELIFHCMFLIGSAVSLFVFYEIEGITITFMFIYIVYYCATSLYSARRHALIVDKRTRRSWWTGLGLIILFSGLTWQHDAIQWLVVIGAGCISVVYVILSLSKDEIDTVLRLTSAQMRRWQTTH